MASQGQAKEAMADVPPRKRRRKQAEARATKADGPLAGLLFSVSVDAERQGDGAAELSFAEVSARCAALGGTYSATVHKKVDVLLASRGAVERRTQRVRKAVKVGVAVVDAALFLDASGDEGRRPDAAEFALRVEPGLAAAAGKAAAGDGAAVQPADGRGAVDINSDAYWVGSTVYDGGCSCACHDEGKLSCEWCAHLHT